MVEMVHTTSEMETYLNSLEQEEISDSDTATNVMIKEVQVQRYVL